MSRIPIAEGAVESIIMQSFLIVAKTKKKQDEELQKLYSKFQIDLFDRVTLGQDSRSIGIEEIRKLKELIFLKPFKGEKKAVVIYNGHNVTKEAQNAFLKILEEPPPSSIIILITFHKDMLLPTILSRCTVIESMDTIVYTSLELGQSTSLLNRILLAENSEKLHIAEEIAKEKERTEQFFEKMILSIRLRLIQNEGQQKRYLPILKAFQKTYVTIASTNVNQRLAIENLFLNLP